MGKQVYIKIDPFMVSKLFKDHPNLFYTKKWIVGRSIHRIGF